VRYERLVLEAEGTTFTLDLHPRLTVLAGVGPEERHALAAELLGALRSNRTGVHLEIVDDAGRHLAVFRPTEGRARVIDVDQVAEVTHEFLDEHGKLDLLRPTGLDLAASRRKLVLRPSDMRTEREGSELIRRLAAVDQGQLWSTAERVLASERTFEAESQAVGASSDDAQLIERVEERHQRMESAISQHERIRKLNLAICAAALVGALTAVVRQLDTVALGFVIAAVLSIGAAFVTRRLASSAAKAEQEALAEAGASSYLGFHLQRVEGMLSGEQSRKRLLEAAAAHREAVAAWADLAGEIPAAWALEHADEVTKAAAARRAIDLRAKATLAVDLDGLDDQTGDPARILVDRISEASHLGGGSESYPLILDDPFAAVDSASRPAVLELLSHAAMSVQLIYLTNDPEVVSWARLEALTGSLSIVEPTAERAPRERLGHV
jgi:hypothetical protein